MIHTIKFTMVGAILFMLILGCTDDTFFGSNSGRMEGSAAIHLTVTIPDVEIIQTRAGVADDASLQNLDVLLFDNSKGNDENNIGLVSHRSITDLTVTTVELPLSSQSRQVYVVANAKDYLTGIPVIDDDLKDSDETYRYSLKNIRDLLVTRSVTPDSDGFVTGASIPNTPLPMSVLINFDKGLTSGSVIDAQLVRMPLKISVSTPLSASQFKIKGLTLCNGAQRGYILAPSNLSQDGKGENRMGYIDGDSTLYAYPTFVGESEAPVSVVVEAQYNGSTTSSFYRLLIDDELTNPDKGISLQRNHHYLIKIKRVNMEGEKDLNAAISSPPANIDYNVQESDDFTNTTIVGGKKFSIDYERTIVYADSLESVALAIFKTNYPIAPGKNEGSITVDAGLTLHGSPSFTASDMTRTLIVDIGSSYSHSHSVDSVKPKGIHLSLGGYTKTIEVIKKPSADLHPIVIGLSDISNAKFLLSSGNAGSQWMSFSTSPTYSRYERSSALTGDILKDSGYKGYLHLDENMISDHRELYFETTSVTGGKTKHFLRQEGTKNYMLGFFGGLLQNAGTVFQYSQQLIIEGYEENENLLSLSSRQLTEDEQNIMYDSFQDGKKSTIMLARDYASPAALYCLNKNRDTNGNGRIDDDEVLWYLPSIRQGVGILLYQALADNLSQSYWSSSCILNEYEEGLTDPPSRFKVTGVWGLNTTRNPQGYAVKLSSYNQATEKRSIRCVRDF